MLPAALEQLALDEQGGRAPVVVDDQLAHARALVQLGDADVRPGTHRDPRQGGGVDPDREHRQAPDGRPAADVQARDCHVARVHRSTPSFPRITRE